MKLIHRSQIWGMLLTCVLCLMAQPSVQAQGLDLTDRQISEVTVVGLDRTDETLVMNQIRMQSGRPYDPRIVARDIENLTRLGRFGSVESRLVRLPSGLLRLEYVVVEQGVLREVAVVGNKALSDQDLLPRVLLRGGDMIDQFQIDRGRLEIEKAFKDIGYNFVRVEVDKKAMSEQNVLIYRVIEGPRIKVWDIEFEGNERFNDSQLRKQIETKTFFPILDKGVMSEEKLTLDISALREFYFGNGYLDARIGRRVVLNARQDRAKIIFQIQEGPVFTVDKIEFRGATLYSRQDLLNVMSLKIGNIMTRKLLSESQADILAKYRNLGYIESNVSILPVFQQTGTRVNVIVQIQEGPKTIVGEVVIRGNTVTQDKVVRRQLRGMRPGMPYDMAGVKRSEQRLSESNLFSDAKITIMGDRNDSIRDALVEVKETRTGSVSFGAAVSDSAGIVGTVSLSQTNFDIADYPESFDELINGAAFVGAGQSFNLTLAPGIEVQNYSVSFSDPSFFDTDFSFGSSLSFSIREFDDYDEQRAGGSIRWGRRFGDVYSGSISVRLAQITISNIDDDAPVDFFDVEGENLLDEITVSLTRNTTDSQLFPTRGSLMRISVSYAGLIGDYDYARANFRFKQFWTVDEDFFGKKSVLSWGVDTGYVFSGEAPIFERYNAGSRSFRGFANRGIGPVGVRRDGSISEDQVGGQFKFVTSLEYNFPIYQDFLRAVIFTDQGTIDNEVSFSDWRISVGAGIRLKIPLLGEAPIAVDAAIPLLKQDTDETQILSFSLDLPLAR